MNDTEQRQPTRRRSRRLWIWLAVVVAVIILGGLLFHRLFKPKPAPPPPNSVTIAIARESDVPILLRGLGQVQALNTFSAKSRVDGNIVQIGYKQGTRVPKGSLLVEVDPRPYQAMLEQAEATRSRDQAQLDNARLDLKRYAELLPAGLTTKQTYDTQAATVRQLVATVRSDSAQIDQARINLSFTQIRAPFSGRTGQRLVDIGNLISASAQTPLVVLTQTQPIYVSFTLPELDLAQVVAAMHGGRVDVEAFDGNDSKLIAKGTLVVLDNTVDPGSGTVRLRAQFDNPDDALWPGEFVNAHIVTAVRQRGVTIPAGAIQMGPNGRFVFLVRNGHAQVAAVSVGQIEAGRALIDSGLVSGDQVVIDGAFGLSSGDRVDVTGQAPNPPVQGTLDLTGRTAPLPEGNSRPPQGKYGREKQGPPPLPTQSETPQLQTGPAGQQLQGKEGPGSRSPLPDERQVPAAPPPSSAERKKQQGAAGGR